MIEDLITAAIKASEQLAAAHKDHADALIARETKPKDQRTARDDLKVSAAYGLELACTETTLKAQDTLVKALLKERKEHG